MRTLFMLSLLVAEAWGCTCTVSPVGSPSCQSAWQYEAVFIGTVVQIRDPVSPMAPIQPSTSRPLWPQRKVRIKITEALAGLKNEDEIVIETGLGGGDCGYGFRRGSDYIVYAYRQPSGALATGICAPTRPVESAAEDLKYFRQLATLPPLVEIRVTAVDVHGAWGVRDGSSRQMPVLAGARVTIDGPGVQQSSTTGSTGRHVFSGLPPGEYKVKASLEGHVTLNEVRPVKVHSKGCAEVVVPLQLDRVVSGLILTNDGQPAAGVPVEAVPTRPRYENDVPSAADSSTTDMNGRYELRRLAKGDYYLGISISGPPTLQNPYTRWFYPGVEDPAAAANLRVSDKAEALRFDLTLPVAQRERIIQGVVFWPGGRPAEGVNIFLEDPRWPWQTSIPAATADKQGRFTVHALDGTRYRLHAATHENGRVSAEPVPINSGADPLELKLVLTRKGYTPHESFGKGLEDWRKGLGLR